MNSDHNTSFYLQPISKLRIYMATKHGLDKPEYSLLELLEAVKVIIHSKGQDNDPTFSHDPFQIVDEIRNLIWTHYTEHPVENVDPGPIEDLLHADITKDVSVAHHGGELSHVRNYMKCSLPNCGFCHIMNDSTPDLCLPDISPRNERHKTSGPKRKRFIKTEVIDLEDSDIPATETFPSPRFEPPLIFPQIGTGSIQDMKTMAWHEAKILFDQGSAESWITKNLADSLSCKFLGNWEGNLITVNGNERITRRAVEFTIFNFKLRKPMTIQALVSESELLSRKERIPDQRFKTICSAFSLKTEEVDHTAGLCHILIGYKLQSIQTARSRRYRAEDFPELRIYRSPAVKYVILVGQHTDDSQGLIPASRCVPRRSLPETSSFSTHTSCDKTFDNQLHEFLIAEKAIPMADVLCEICSRASDCAGCKAARSESTFVEISEDAVIRKALEIHKISEKGEEIINEFRINYPTYMDLNTVYTKNNCNDNMARQASLSLRRKLAKGNKIQAFHDKVMESVEAGHVVIMTPDLIDQHADLPRSYQLVNVVYKDSSASTKVRVVTNSSVHRLGGSFNN